MHCGGNIVSWALRCCASVAKGGYIVARPADTRNVSEDLSETFFASATNVARVAKRVNTVGKSFLVLPFPRFEAGEIFFMHVDENQSVRLLRSSLLQSKIQRKCAFTHCIKPRLSYPNAGPFCVAQLLRACSVAIGESQYLRGCSWCGCSGLQYPDRLANGKGTFCSWKRLERLWRPRRRVVCACAY